MKLLGVWQLTVKNLPGLMETSAETPALPQIMFFIYCSSNPSVQFWDKFGERASGEIALGNSADTLCVMKLEYSVAPYG